MSLGAFFSEAAKAHDRAHMAAEDIRASLFRFLGSQGVEELMMLRRILNLDAESATNNYFDGLTSGFLYCKHGVNPDTGKSMEEALSLTDSSIADRGETPGAAS